MLLGEERDKNKKMKQPSTKNHPDYTIMRHNRRKRTGRHFQQHDKKIGTNTRKRRMHCPRASACKAHANNFLNLKIDYSTQEKQKHHFLV